MPEVRTGAMKFVLHLGEMLIAMFLGMLVLGGAIEIALVAAGGSLGDASASVQATVMAFTMTAPMVWWMRFRGHPRSHNLEMAASMIVPTAVVIGLHWLGAISAGGVLVLQHAVMIPAMVAVMLWRYDHYSH
jgi:flagellar biosynthetic protein FliP